MADVNLNGRIRIRSDQSVDRALQNLQNLNHSVGELDRRLKGSANATSNSTKAFAKMSQGLGGLVQAYAFVAANVFAASSAFNTLRDAARVEQLTQSMQAFATATGVGASSIVKSLKQITDYALSTQDAMRITAQATASGFSGAQLKEIVKVASDASKVLGRDMGDSVDRLVRGVSKLEPELIDEIGLMTRVDEAARNYALSVGKSASNLTSFEKRMAFANAVIEEGRKKFGLLGDEVEANPFDKLAARFSELANKLLKPIAELGARIGSLILDNLETTIATGALVLINVIDGMMETVTRKMEQRLDRTNKEAARTRELITKISARELRTPEYQDISRQTIKASDTFSTNLKRLGAKPDFKEDPSFKAILEATGTPAVDRIQTLKPIIKENKELIKIAKELKTLEDASTLQGQQTIANLDEEIKRLREINRLAGQQIKLTAQELEQQKFIQNARQKYLDESKTYQRLLTQQAKETAGVDIARVTESFGIGGGLKEGFGRLKEFLGGTAYGDQATEEEKKTQARINSMGKLEKATFAFSEGLGIIEQTFGKVFGLVTRFTNVIGIFITAYTLAKEGWKAFMETIGASSEALDEAKASSEALTKQIQELSETQEFFDNLVKAGYGIEAFKQKAQTLQTLIEGVSSSGKEYIEALKEIEKKEKQIAETGNTFANYIGEELLGRRTAARKQAVSDLLKSQEEGVNALLSRLNTTQIEEFDKALNSAFGGDFGYILDKANKKIIFVQSEFDRLATKMGGVSAAAYQMGTAITNGLVAGVASISNFSDKLSIFETAIKTLADSSSKALIASIPVTPERQRQVDAEAATAAFKDLIAARKEFSKESLDTPEGIEAANVALQQMEAKLNSITPQFERLQIPEPEKNKLIAQVELLKTENTQLLKETDRKKLVSEGRAIVEESKKIAEEVNKVKAQALSGANARLGVPNYTPQQVKQLEDLKQRQAALDTRTTSVVQGLGNLGVVGIDTSNLDNFDSSLKQVENTTIRVGNALKSNTESEKQVIEVLGNIEVGTRNAADAVDERTLATIKATNALSSLQQVSDGSFSKLAAVAAAETNVVTARINELSLSIENSRNLIEDSSIGPALKSAEQANLNKKVEERNGLYIEQQKAVQKVSFYQELSTINLTDTGALETKLLSLREKYPQLFSEIANLLSYINELTALQNEQELKGIQVSKQKLEGVIDLRKSLQGDLFSARTTVSEFKDLQALAREETLRPLDNQIAQLRKEISQRAGSTEAQDITANILAEERIRNLEQDKINEDELLVIKQRKEAIDYARETLEYENKFVVSFGSMNEASQQIWYQIGVDFETSIQNSMGFVQGAANIFTGAVDSAADSFVDAIIEGKDVLESVKEGLRESLIGTIGDLAKDQLKQGLKLGIGQLPMFQRDEQGKLKNPALEKLADSLKPQEEKNAAAIAEAQKANFTQVTDNATTNANNIIAAIQSKPVSTRGIGIPTAPNTVTNIPKLPSIDEMIGKPYTPTNMDSSKIGDTWFEQSQKNEEKGLYLGYQQLDLTGRTAENTGKGVNVTQSGFATNNRLTEILTDSTVAGFASIATAIAAGRSTKSSIIGGILGIAGTVAGSMIPGLGPYGAAIGGQIGAMVGARGFASGGVMSSEGPMPLRMYAKGGVANSPQLAMFGEGRMPEAYVPLPDGRSIPVTMQGSGGNVNNISVNVAVDNKGNSQTSTGGTNSEDYSQKLGTAISNAVKSEIANQQRPGGLLYRGRR